MAMWERAATEIADSRGGTKEDVMAGNVKGIPVSGATALQKKLLRL